VRPEPQYVEPPPAILLFRGKNRFLSNFYIEPDGTCVEVEYQAAKCADPEEARRFSGMRPGDAKRFGRRVKLRKDWESVKIQVMREFVFQKFKEHLSLRIQLLATGEAELIEGNHWGDKFWGKTEDGFGGGSNYLGRILMEVRETLKK